MQPIILIPSRLASTRLPNKPLADIGGLPMIVQVLKRANESGVARVVVACDGEEIAAAVRAAGGEAVLTDPALPSGSDRIWQALSKLEDSDQHDIIINLQGDMPTLDPAVIREVLKPLADPKVDIATLAAMITDEDEKTDPAVVKVILGEGQGNIKTALNFTRITPETSPMYHHIGIYAYRRAALEKFVSLPPSTREKEEKLEQLRALDAKMRIDVAVVNTVPLGVDTPETLEKARRQMGIMGE